MGQYAKTGRTTALRDRDRMHYDADVVHAVLDEAYVCHVGFVVDGEPRVLPTLFVRVGDTVFLHGSTGSRPLLAARDGGLPVCVTVTLLDGIVYARSQFHHSANYRSVVAHGVAHLVTDEAAKRGAMSALVDKVGAGRAADSRPPDSKELAQTAMLALRLDEVSAKIRSGGVIDDPEDYELPYWAGVVPLRLVAGRPEPDSEVAVPVPDYLRPDRSSWLAAPTLCGQHVVLEALDLSHVDGLFAALDGAEVWQDLATPRPTDRPHLAEIVASLLDDPARVLFVVKDAATGAIVGATSYESPDPVNRHIAIGPTWLGRKWWSTGADTESASLLVSRAFDDLGAIRVEWRTDLGNERAWRATERLGATREGVLRAYRCHADGTARHGVLYAMTSAEWSARRARLPGLSR
jgi:nitroimidazol reductase NimA-like FMN-containing flavoprotein (pyridoxamine 5'-phosphate oxidase superfamily)/RimJ/RimL family protein N-acetyltransferase